MAAAPAQDKYPSKPIRVIVPFSAGSATDIVPRAIFERMTADLGQSLVVENRGGAGGTLGAAAVAKAEPDGYTLLAHSAAHSVAPSIYPELSLRHGGRFQSHHSVGQCADRSGGGALERLQRHSPTLTAAAKAKPGGLNYASAGVGTGTHMAAERYIQSAGIKAVHIPFKGGPEALTEVLTGRVDFMFGALPSAYPHIRSGALMALAVSPQKRISVLPDVPTTEEAGYADSHYDVWLGLLAPAKTPPEIIETTARRDRQGHGAAGGAGAAQAARHGAAVAHARRNSMRKFATRSTANAKLIKNAGIKPN